MTDTHDTGTRTGRRGARRASRRRFRRYAVALVAGATSGLVMTPAPAFAQPFGPGACNGGCFYADNANETFFYNGLTVGAINVIDFARTQRLEPTDMTTQLQGSSNGDTDVIVSDDYFGTTGIPAWWQCTALVSGSSTKCNQGVIVFNLTYTPSYAVACQEVGHAVGLDHSTSTGTCMHNPPPVSYYDTHDKGHINGYY